MITAYAIRRTRGTRRSGRAFAVVGRQREGLVAAAHLEEQLLEHGVVHGDEVVGEDARKPLSPRSVRRVAVVGEEAERAQRGLQQKRGSVRMRSQSHAVKQKTWR